MKNYLPKTKTINFILLAFTCFTLSVLQSQNTSNYPELWQKVQRFEIKKLPKSASEIVDSIYHKASLENNSPQLIKSLIYQSKFALILKENAHLQVIQHLKNEISRASAPTKNILESILGDLYWQYYQQNRWKFYKRTTSSEKMDSLDFRTWDLQTLFITVHNHYQNSLKNSDLLKKTTLKLFNNILVLSKNSKQFRPTLYDFLAYRAIDFYKNKENYLTRPSYKFEINDTRLLGSIQEFIAATIPTKDSLSQHLHAVKLYQDLSVFHLNDKNPAAFINLTLNRLRFIKNNAVFENKDSVYLNTLLNLKNKYKKHEASSNINFEIAQIYYELSSKYVPKTNTKNQFKRQDALKECEQAIALFPKATGTKKCKVLKNKILQLHLAITAEKYIPINTPSRLLVAYKNINNLYFYAVKINNKQQEVYSKIYNDSARVAFIKKLIVTKKWDAHLKNEHDYQIHKTEILVPELPQGRYLILATPNNPKILPNKTIAFSILQVTNLALVENHNNGEYHYQIVDRNTGNPIKKASVNLKNYNTGRYNKPLNKNFKTNEFGQFSYKSRKDYSNIIITANHGNDTATFGDYYFYKHQKRDYQDDDEEIIIKSFLFTDRSIYRPGQTVYFKGIFIKKIGDKTSLFTNEYVEIILEDPNGEDVKQLDLKINEYGSVSGEFKLPSSGLTGQYTIYIDESYEYDSKFYDNEDFYFEDEYDFTIAVEEYKRPKFEAIFNPVKETYQLNDSITVKGTAEAFSGSKISHAKVAYRVVRTANFPIWYNWYASNYFDSPKLEITHGETETDENGLYNITFKAIPDLEIPKENMPTFNYKVYADITDINGETHSAETIVKVGYHSLTISANIAAKVDQLKTDNVLTISSNNLNGEFVPTKGTLKIYKLKSPQNPLRERPWSEPDYQLFTENEFRNYFPHDPFTEDENVEKNWKKGPLVAEYNFDTGKSKKIILENMKEWVTGKYLLIAEGNDKFGQQIIAKKRFSVFNSKNTHVSDNKLFEINTDKFVYHANEMVQLQIGSASKDISVTLEIEKQHRIVTRYIIHLNNEIKTISIPVYKEDEGGFAIKYHYVNYNSFKSGSILVNVPYTQNNLQIETLTFRDKIQPGSKQTWSFKIKGSNSTKVAAEVLASMYDASLDKFKSHDWNFNPITRYGYYSNIQINASKSFGTKNFAIRNKPSVYYSFFQQQYDALNWFGFSFRNNSYTNRYYLTKTKKAIKSERAKYDKIISGTVTDESGPLPGVNITIRGTNFGTQTDFDGHYSIKVKSGDQLVFSFIGMITASKVIGNQSKIDVQLEASEEHLDEVVVTALGIKRNNKALGYSVSTVFSDKIAATDDIATILAGKVSGVQITGAAGASDKITIRGMSSASTKNKLLFIVDGVPVEDFDIEANELAGLSILKGTEAVALYGAKAANGVIIISTKKGQETLDLQLSKVNARKNFNETAFFYPHLKTDKNGEIQFSFNTPESLTRWKLQLLAHTKNLEIAIKSLSTITQKELMVTPNAPRFLREGDQIVFSSKISNLTKNSMQGLAVLLLTNVITGAKINTITKETPKQHFSIAKNGNTTVNWTLKIPDSIQAIQYKVIATAGNFSDGEQNILPVLSNRMLITETLPMHIKAKSNRTFTLDKLKNNTSSSLKNHQLTLEITTNPAWYAIQSLPYLIEYPYECAEQTFSRYYANTLAGYIVNTNPQIKQVFKQWKSSKALISNLEKNPELKSIIIQETPWIRDAQSSAEQKKRIALLFDLNNIESESKKATNKLKQMQFSNGGFPWFKGNRFPNRYITQHIAIGFGHLQHLNVILPKKKIAKLISKSVTYLDREILNDYTKLLEKAKQLREKEKSKEKGMEVERKFLAQKHLHPTQLHYLYMRSFYNTLKPSENIQKAIDYYTTQAKNYWTTVNLYEEGLIALVMYRNGNETLSKDIVKSLKENSILHEELGRYWKNNVSSWNWYQSPIETQALLIEAFSEITNDTTTVNELKTWLLKNKQTTQWKTTKATTDAIYALLLQGTDWISTANTLTVTVGGEKILPLKDNSESIEAGTGYFKTHWSGNEITTKMNEITISNTGEGVSWGSLYWQYFEDMDKVTKAKTPLELTKKLYLKVNTDTGKKLIDISETTPLKVGDLITVKIILKVDRAMEFIHLKDMRASGLEPVNVLSQYKWQDGMGYYESTRDAATNFFIDYLPKGVFVFEYDLRVNNVGIFSNGVTTIQSMYAPEFSSHSKGIKITINN